jgi:hypothetical protein
MTNDQKSTEPPLSELFDKIVNSKGYEIESRIATLQSNFFIFEGNYKDLMHFMALARESENIPKLFAPDSGNNVLKHIVRYFHNFVVASMMLVDTTRVYMQKNYEDSEFRKEYDSEKGKRFVDNPIHNFIKKLRIFCFHYELPISSLTITVTNSENGQKEAVQFSIDKQQLEKWSGWGSGKQFLKTQKKNIDVEELATEYYLQVRKFHIWMSDRLQEIHKPELTELENFRMKAKKWVKPNRSNEYPGILP